MAYRALRHITTANVTDQHKAAIAEINQGRRDRWDITTPISTRYRPGDTINESLFSPEDIRELLNRKAITEVK